MAKVSFDFAGNNYLVTGASSGIGKQVVLDLASSGAKVLALARREEELRKVQKICPDNISVVPVDVCDKNAVREAVSSFVADSGPVNGFVHAAGVYEFSPVNVFDKEQFYKMMEINFWSGFDIVQFLSKKKFSADYASFVMFSSVAAIKGEKGCFVYSATKAAVSTAVRSVAKEICGRHLRINAVMPGSVATPMTNVNGIDNLTDKILFGMGVPSDVSSPVLFLLSDGAKWITGTDFVVDGGYLIN